MKWFWQSNSGTTSGYTRTIVSEVVQLIEEQNVSIDRTLVKGTGISTTDYKNKFKKNVSYNVLYIRTFSDKQTEFVFYQQGIDNKEEANQMYKHLIESKGRTKHKKTVKEKIIKID